MILTKIFDRDFTYSCKQVLGNEFYERLKTKYNADNFIFFELCMKRIFKHPAKYNSDLIDYFMIVYKNILEMA